MNMKNPGVKYHTTKDGKLGMCSANVRVCPLGGEHYDSPKEWAEAQMQATREQQEKVNGDADKALIPAAPVESIFEELQRKSAEAKQRNVERAAHDELAALQAEAVRLAVDPDWISATPEQAAMALAPERIAGNAHRFYDYLKEQGLEDDTATREAAFTYAAKHYGVSYQRFYDAWLDERDLGQDHEFWQDHGQHLGLAPLDATMYSFDKVTEANSSQSQVANSSDGRDPRHRYGAHGAKTLFEEETPTHQSNGPKELDPAMIEALKLKYLKKFKQPFDESGLSIPELLQMAQKGELD